MFKNVASQTVTLSVFDSATGTQKAGDAANLLFYVDKDDAGPVAIASNSGVPSEISSTNSKGDYKIALSQSETNADKLHFTGKSSTSGIVVVSKTIYTVPANFTKLVIDAAGLADGNMVKVGPTGAGTAQTAADLGLIPAAFETGTAQTGSTSTTLKLRSGASATNDIFKDQAVFLTGGTGAGQTNRFTGYVGSTKVGTVETAWVVTPDNTTTYVVLGRVG